jgi:hypothetical protein
MTTLTLLNGKTYQIRAWTGGRSNYRHCPHRDFNWLRRYFFRRQIADCIRLDFWACAGTSPLERARIFWNRASLDAFATLELN